MPKFFTIAIAKLVLRLGRLFGKGGTSLPGLVAERIDPDILSKLAVGNFPEGIVIITGTNGKTTTATLSATLLRDGGKKVLHNHGGSNLYRGIVATIITHSALSGRVRADMAVLEVDENAVERVAHALHPTRILVTNLFRDQLDRYGELDTTAQKLRQVLYDNTQAQFILNADDPLVASLAGSHTRITYFGVADYKQTSLSDEHSADSIRSPKSGSPLVYTKRYYSHIGIYHSADKDFRRPTPQIEATKVKLSENSMTLSIDGNHMTIPIGGFYNVYNVLAAYSVAQSFDMAKEQIITSLTYAKPAFGRMEKVRYHDHDLHMLLIKNPVGFNQIIENFLLEHPSSPILFVLNDNFADSRDVSWIWDANVEALSHHSGQVIAAGQRAHDMSLRLKYANVGKVTTINDPIDALNQLCQEKTKQVFVVPTYTAMLALRSYLVSRGSVGEYWK